MNALYINIKNRRLELGMSQEELAIKMGYTSRSTIAKIEAGKNDIPQSKIQAFAKALDTTPGALMGWEKTPNQKSSNLLLSPHEKDLIIAYRENPNMQSAVDTLLGISTASTVHPMEAPHQIYRAARSTDHHEHTIQTRSASDIEKLTNAPKVTSDDDL